MCNMCISGTVVKRLRDFLGIEFLQLPLVPGNDFGQELRCRFVDSFLAFGNFDALTCQ